MKLKMHFLGVPYEREAKLRELYGDPDIGRDLREMADECGDPVLAGLLRLAALDADADAAALKACDP